MPTSEDGAVAAPAGMVFDSPTVYTGPDMEQAVQAGAPEPAVIFQGPGGTGVNTTTTLQTRISGTCPAMQGGTYKVTLSYRWSYDNASSDFFSRFSFDGTPLTDRTNGETHRQEPKDSAGGNIDGTGTTQVYAYTHVSTVTIAADATPAVLLEWGSEVAGNESSIWDDRIIIERIGP